MTRAASGRTSAGRIASPATATERRGSLIGLSSRSHAVAIAAAGMSAVRSALGNARLRTAERAGEVRPRAHDSDRDPGCLEPEQLRLGPAGRIDIDERGPATRKGALDEPVHER